MLPTGESRLGEGDGVFVNGNHTAFQITRKGMRSTEVVCPYSIEQSKGCVVGELKSFFISGK